MYKLISVICHINWIKENHTINSSNTEKAFDEHPLMIKNTLKKLRIEGNFLNEIKTIYEKFTANILLKSERLSFCLGWWKSFENR